MDIQTILSEVHHWPVEDRLRLIAEVWDGISGEAPAPELTDDLRALLDRRLAALDADPDDVLTWDQITSHARRSR